MNLKPACQTAQYSGCVSKLPPSSVHGALLQSLWDERVFEMTALGHEGDGFSGILGHFKKKKHHVNDFQAWFDCQQLGHINKSTAAARGSWHFIF